VANSGANSGANSRTKRGKPGRTGSKQRLFLHVGSPKTGTTFLQQVLWKHRQVARDQGLLLPGATFHDHYLASLDVRELAEQRNAPARTAGMWARLMREAARWSGDSLASHELFAPATADQAQHALSQVPAHLEVHLVLTVRDWARQIPAEWQEHVKHRYRGNFAEFVAELREHKPKNWYWLVQDFADVAGRWGSSLPPDQVHIVTVPPAGSNPAELWSRFAGLLDLDPVSFSLEGGRDNTSLGLEQTELLRRINVSLKDRLPIPGPYPGTVKEVLAHRILAHHPGTKLAMDQAAFSFAADQSLRIRDALGNAHYQVVGTLDDLNPPQPGLTSVPQVAEDRLLAEATESLADLLVELERRQRRIRQLEQKLADRTWVHRIARKVGRRARATYRKLRGKMGQEIGTS
jgi:hypothetical protein